MQVKTIVTYLIKRLPGSMHAARRDALQSLVWSAIRTQTLTVTGLGRTLPGPAKEKHCIKRADRLLSNRHLQGECFEVYRALARSLIGAQRHPVLLIDWSDLDRVKRHQVLRVSLALAGRALTVYEEVHNRATAEKRATHKRLLQRLKRILPAHCQPVLVADAGFRTPWFRQVEAQGWYWVARIRHRHLMQWQAGGDWQPARALYVQATHRPRSLGAVRLTRNTPHRCRLVLYRGPIRGRHRRNRQGQRAHHSNSEKHARAQREPWLLATNLPASRSLAKKVVRLYRRRMQIEEAFRDLKSRRFGLGLEYHNTRNTGRLAVLLLIAALALLLLWLLGQAARTQGLERAYQANTVRNRQVLSVIYLGLRLCTREQEHFTADQIRTAWQDIHQLNSNCWDHEP